MIIILYCAALICTAVLISIVMTNRIPHLLNSGDAEILQQLPSQFNTLFNTTSDTLQILSTQFNDALDIIQKVAPKHIDEFCHNKYKDIIVDLEYVPHWDGMKTLVFGINFTIIGGDTHEGDVERKKLIEYLGNENRTVTLVCTEYENNGPNIVRIGQFLQKIDSVTRIKDKLTIYNIPKNNLGTKVIIFDANCAYYQLALAGSDAFDEKFKNFCIKIDETTVIRNIIQAIRDEIGKIKPLDLEEELKRANELTDHR